MTAAIARAELASLARAVLDGEELSTRLAEVSANGVTRWEDLAGIPDWLKGGADARRDLARRVALLAMADTLASSIDGDWLGALAQRAGEPALDWAIRQAGSLPFPPAGRVEADALDRAGFGILAALLSPALRRFLPGAPTPGVARETARWLVDQVLAG